jgi:hypothetical protein
MSLITIPIFAVPGHIRRSQHYATFMELSQCTDVINLDPNFYVNSDVYIESLEISSSESIHKVIAADSYLGFSFDDRIAILRNINVFWLTTDNPIIRPNPKLSFFAAQVHVLLSERCSGIVMHCMKKNYSELLEYAIQDHFPRNNSIMPDVCDLYYAACNSSVDCFRIGIKHGFVMSMHAVAEVARRGNPEMLQMMVEVDCPKTTRACEEATTVETLEFLLKHGFTMSYTTLEQAAKTGNLEKMRFAIDRGCVVPINICDQAARCGNAECLRLALTLCDKRSPIIMRNIIDSDNLETFLVAIEHGILPTEHDLVYVIERRCINITPGRIRKLL